MDSFQKLPDTESDKGPEVVNYEVDWKGPDDPNKPMNWPKSRKQGIIIAVCAMRFTTPLASSMMSPALLVIGKDFPDASETLLSFSVSIYIIGFGLGPLLLAPLSEVYGRNVIYHVGNIMFTVFTVCCGLSPNIGALLAFRLMAGFFGGAPLTNGGGTIADLVPAEKRGLIMSIFSASMLMGPVLGPVIGGFLAEVGWRWIFWVLTVLSGLTTIVGFIFLRETFAPVLLEKIARQLREKTGDSRYYAKGKSDKKLSHLLLGAVTRPTRMLVNPIIIGTSVYMAVMYGIIYLLFTTFSVVFQRNYGFKEGIAGLAYLGIGVGSALGMFLFGRYSDRIYSRLTSKHQQAKPEFRLPPLIPSAVSMPVGLIIYGWTAQYKLHWILPIIGTGFSGLSVMGCLASIQAYLVDEFTVFAASALAANGLIRSIAGGLVPLGGLGLYERIGLGWGNTLLAFLSILFSLPAVAFYKYGERMRQCRVGLD
ncbi:MFS general substrate transporter [Aspergillus steynii IBT 23096]|uniref:MFS general substrate transporter n=1 Tax=Aspergillus steynii IBT 23096 TaxID=1392250 RepID=A0A2I2G6I3_9EURO|nr:MFS general substrate transporter [Aspergillus steynii IBT 23096]PLB48473.1 MFS general substrate transporter [Aspergillus steynii IBT 23096]